MRFAPLIIFVFLACDGSTLQPLPRGVGLETVASGLAAPVHLTAPQGDARLFIVEQAGRIRIVKSGQLLAQPFLDITARVRSGNERGLLGLAFHPQYASNGWFYVNFTDLDGNTRVERFTVGADPDVADAGSSELVIGFTQPFANHNGGLVTFGPDGMLWIGTGDGGSAGDPEGNGQSTNTLLGKLLRLDVTSASPYAIPPDNPFAGGGGLPEIWAYGLRNPWRFSFDLETGLLYIADVGQGRLEEVNVQPAEALGLNYGWAVMEGTDCYNQETCDMTGLVLPVYEYTHGEGCSITGGHVYRGSDVPALAGRYIFGDYCEGWVRSFRLIAGNAAEVEDLQVGQIGNILSFGEDSSGELYVLTGNGMVRRFVAAEP